MHTIIACIDGSASTEAISLAGAWASQRLAQPLTLLHALEKPATPPAADLSGAIGLGSREHLLEELTALDERRERLALEHGKHLLQAAEAVARRAGAAEVTQRQRHGDLVSTLADLEDDTRLVILGRQGEDHAAEANAIGSHLESVVRRIQRPILVTLQVFRPPRSFMIAFDGSATAQKALDRVAGSPLLAGLPCHLVSVGPLTEDQRRQVAEATGALQAAGFAVTVATLEGDVQSTLNRYHREQQVDLMVMGAWGHSRIRQFFVGSNTTRMLSQAEMTLLLLR
ncbi:MAG: universal stress protein UspA [Haliea sp.]|uniref:universal stress protein n=1 Tax=Haliea sp. TaxID=1932666 RepID=UPI000C451595|nr:universal stress protein [Haliea sp.]MBM69446.1 universal stress protein UspA [Haliea sp.]|tara:strand:- start:12768 stop:13619 length:852 start_codon:yes stop_codon:yes gene_type:complete